MNKIVKILIGLLLLIIPIYAWISNFAGFGTSAWEFFKGGIMWIVILIGFVFLIIGIYDLKE